MTTTDETVTDDDEKICFVVSAFGTDTEEQTRTKQVLRHLVRKVLVPRGYKVIRADEIDEEGLITNQIIGHLLQDALVVADLTGSNPNVFYEVAVRHAANKPIVHLITAGDTIPFDVAHMRAVPYALDDPDLLEEAQRELAKKVAAIEESGSKAGPNPVTVGRDVTILRESDTPELRERGELLAALNEIRDQLRSLAVRGDSGPQASSPRLSVKATQPSAPEVLDRLLEKVVDVQLHTTSQLPRDVLAFLLRKRSASVEEISEKVGAAENEVLVCLEDLQQADLVAQFGPAWEVVSQFKQYVRNRVGRYV